MLYERNVACCQSVLLLMPPFPLQRRTQFRLQYHLLMHFFLSLPSYYKPTDIRIVITAGYIIESGLGVVVVASVAEGVEVGYAVGAGNGGAGVVGDGQEPSPSVVGCAVLPYRLAVPGDILIIENRKNCPTP